MQERPFTNKQIALLKSEDDFRALVEKSTDAIQLLDAKGQILFSGKSVERMLGYTAEELKNVTPADFVHPEDLPLFIRSFSRLVKKPGSRTRLEYRVRHKSGKWIWLESIGVNYLNDPSIHALIGDFRDITKRKEIERALAESEARLRFMAESMPQKIFTVDSKGRPDYFNPQWAEFTGLPFEEINQSLFEKIIHPDDYAITTEAWRNAITTGEGFTLEHRFKGGDGIYHWHLTRMRSMHDQNDKIVMWIGSSTDIDDVKQAQRRERRLEQKTLQLTKLNKAKDEFISLASHQLRTPATGVKQYLAMILEGYLDVAVPEEVRKLIQVAYKSNEQQLKIVDDLLRVATVDSGKLKIQKDACDIISLLKSVVQDQRPIFTARKQKLEYKRHCKTKYVNGDTRLIRMVLEIILDNAGNYMDEGKTVHVTERCTKKYICIIIKDEGVGMSTDDQTQLFKKFSRIDNPMSQAVQGSGLGLYWAQQVMELHGGSIKVKSEVNKGSTFTVKIPLALKPID